MPCPLKKLYAMFSAEKLFTINIILNYRKKYTLNIPKILLWTCLRSAMVEMSPNRAIYCFMLLLAVRLLLIWTETYKIKIKGFFWIRSISPIHEIYIVKKISTKKTYNRVRKEPAGVVNNHKYFQCYHRPQ